MTSATSPTPATTATPPLARTAADRTLSIAVACVATVMLMLDVSVVNTALDDIAAGLGASLSGLQWVIDAYTLPLAAVVLSAGSIADRVGRKQVFLGGMVLFTAASAACAVSPGIGTLVAARAVQGIGAAVLFATALALISEVTPTAEERARALGVYGASIGAAFAIGPFVGGVLTDAIGWRAIFWCNVPIGLLALALARRVQESRDPQARRLDVPGQLALVAGLFLLVLALLRGNEDGWGSGLVAGSLAGAAVALGALVVIEHRSRAPMLPLRHFRQPAFSAPQVLVFGISASFFAGFLYLTLYLQGVVGLSPLQTGLAYLPGTALVFVVSGTTAGLMTRFAPAALAVVGLLLVAAGMAVFAWTTHADSGWASILPGFLLASVGTGLFNPSGSALALAALPPEQSGLAAGANDTFRQTGLAVGVAWLGTFVPAAGPYGADAAGFVDGLHHAVLAGAVVALGCAVVGGVLLRAGHGRGGAVEGHSR
ncbi:MFS transporter [Nocardioides kongjuensis]|uniref:EmrB/QacA subfamily drug resistance transporter n=1 Tax=Nocardioides kongjuensis TaxID=349522 RepID=A0A852RB05_9ACTN|nr:MFS transporter [Nocardioides kongjuensis]NYD28505.1 EmrB/QacA subfamily drug resistance transporter [Nocardioides kongjuensis]